MNQIKQYIRVGGARRRKRITTQQTTPLQQVQLPDGLAIGYCNRTMREMILNYDHHVVEIRGRKGLLFTFHLKLELPAERNLVVVVFDHVEQYAPASAEMQQIINRIAWRIKPR